MESGVSTEKSKIMTNSMKNIGSDITMNCQTTEQVTSVQCLGATLCKDGTCSAEVRIRIASAVAAMIRLNRIWRCSTVSSASRFKLYESLVTSILPYSCDTWTLLVDSENRIQALQVKCLRKLLRIFYVEHRTNGWMRSKINFYMEHRTNGWVRSKINFYLEHRTNGWVRSKINFLVATKEPFRAISENGNLHGSGMSHATTASPKPSFMAPWRVGNAVVSRENAGWTTSKSYIPAHARAALSNLVK